VAHARAQRESAPVDMRSCAASRAPPFPFVASPCSLMKSPLPSCSGSLSSVSRGFQPAYASTVRRSCAAMVRAAAPSTSGKTLRASRSHRCQQGSYAGGVDDDRERPLSGRVAVVTGASHEIGAAMAEELARLGAAVAIAHCEAPELAEAVADRIRSAGGRAIEVASDTSLSYANRRLVERI